MDEAALVKEEFERVFGLYGAQLRTFHRVLYGLLLTGTMIFALIVVPFLGFSGQKAAFEAEELVLASAKEANAAVLDQRKVEVETMRGILAEIRRFADRSRAYDTYQQLIKIARERQDVVLSKRAEYGDHALPGLRDWAAGRIPVPPPEAFQTERYLPLGIKDQCEWRLTGTADGTTAYVACRVCDDFRDINNAFSSRLTRMSAGGSATVTDGEIALGDIVERACGWLVGGEAHWISTTARPVNPNQIRSFFSKDLQAYEAALTDLRKDINQRLPQVEVEVAQLERESMAMKARLETVTAQLSRLSEFDKLGTPIGDVPVTLNQLVLLFPVALALGFLAVANSMGRLVVLRRELSRLGARRDANAAVIDDAHIAAIAPMWLDRRDGAFTWVAKLTVLFTPLGLVIANLWLVYRTDALSDEFPATSAISSSVYLWLYAASLALMLGALIHIARTVSAGRGYR